MASRIFITGGGSGIGRETAILFAKNGWKVGVSDLDANAAGRVAQEIAEGAAAFAIDVLDPGSIARALWEFCGAGGSLDLLFACAGVAIMRPFCETLLEGHHRVIDVNVKGVLNSIHTALPYLRQSQDARIVSMSSTAAVYGVPDEAAYSASKFAVRGLTEALNIEFEPLGIWVCDIIAGYTATPMVLAAEHRAKSVDILGVNTAPRAVAEMVWCAAQGRQVHWFITPTDSRYFDKINAASPDDRRRVMKSISGY